MKEIPSAPGYYATEDGDIISKRLGRPLTPVIANKYLRVRLSIDGKIKNRYIHRLVCEAYHGACPSGYQASHIDGDRFNCRPENLGWETPLQNTRRKYIHGSMHARRKVSPEVEKEIHGRLALGQTQTRIAVDLGLSQSTISNYKLSKAKKET